MSLGSYRKSLADRLAESVKKGVLEAQADMREAFIGAEKSRLPGLNGNRREPDGQVDDELVVVKIRQKNDQGILVNYPVPPAMPLKLALNKVFSGASVEANRDEGFFPRRYSFF